MRDGTAEPVSRDKIFRRERGQENIIFLCSADHVQDWQPYPVDPYSCYMCDYTIIVPVNTKQQQQQQSIRHYVDIYDNHQSLGAKCMIIISNHQSTIIVKY